MDRRGVARDLSAKMLLNLLSPTGDALDKLCAGRIASVAPRIEGICGAHQLAALDARDLRDDQDRHREHDVVIAEPGGRVLHDAGRGRVEAALAPLDEKASLVRLPPVAARRKWGACPHSA